MRPSAHERLIERRRRLLSESSHHGNHATAAAPSIPRTMPLRRPNFDSVAGGGDGVHVFAKQCIDDLFCRPYDGEAEDDEVDEEEDEHAVSVNDCVAESRKDPRVSVEKCVTLLEPHLQHFRERCEDRESSNRKRKAPGDEPGEHLDGESEREDEVPQQLVNLIRFFPERWLPVKKALLRPPSETGVEVSLPWRLRLANACKRRGLVATAEAESFENMLETSRRSGEARGDGRASGRSLSPPPTLTDRIRVSLMRLPSECARPDRAAATAWRHTKSMLLESCREDEGDEVDLTQVADWSMTCWTVLLVERGPDVPTQKSSSGSVETQLASLLTDRSDANPTLKLAQVVATRIDALLAPDCLVKLNGIQLMSLGRLLAFHQSQDAAGNHLITSIVKHAAQDGICGLEQLSRLLAVHASCLAANRNKNVETNDGAGGLERRLVEKMNSKLIPEETAERSRSFLALVLGSTAYLVKTRTER